MTSRLMRGLSANVAGGLVPMAVTLVVTPFYLHLIGLERFGVLSLVWLLLGYLGIFDLGFGRTVASAVARDSDERRRSEFLWTGLVLSGLGGAAGALIAYGISRFFFDQIFSVSSELSGEIAAALLTLMAILPLVTISSVLTGYLQGREQFGKLNLAQSAGTILFQTAPLLVGWMVSVELPWLAVGALLGRLGGVFLLLAYCMLSSSEARTPRFSAQDVRPMLSFGGWTMASGVINQLMLTMDRFVIGAVSSVNAVAIYSLPYNVIIRATLIPYSWFSVLFPRFAAAKDDDEARGILVFGSRVLLLAITPITVGGLVILKPFLDLWVGREISEQAVPAGTLLMAGFWFYAMTFMPLALFQARGRASVPARAYAVEFVLFVPLLYVAVDQAGVVGAAAAWVFRALLDGALLYWAAGKGALYWKNLALALPALLPVSVFELFFREIEFYMPLKLLCLVWTGVYVLLLLNKDERTMIIQAIRSRSLSKS
ncbi:oligosaccharide flippase family protein [Ciceribacter sp. L1K22]|uniref:oligosaccharide flippase family protein n=1 Tax=Ciceribacter sp. L1K22 TaxID=2820275 RepID=UPI001ABEDCB9|nr:oligosaccharide flippase family protein [Ciceribacter sp. L1K22]MBO3762222.1 oligosaccharide flippase family protein [Ciceribacter sp. L1K22]